MNPLQAVGRVKWPFVLGALLLAGAALTWAMSQDWWARVFSSSASEQPAAPLPPEPKARPAKPPSYTPAPFPARVAEAPKVAEESPVAPPPVPVIPTTPMPPTPRETAEQRRQRLQQEAEARKRREQELKSWKPGSGQITPSTPEKGAGLQPLKTPYSLPPARKIPCVTENRISNEAPGVFLVQVSEPVWNVARTAVVIPQGAVFLGKPAGRSIFGEERIAAELLTLTFPNGDYLKMPKSSLGDQAGTAGLTDQVDRHIWRILGSVVLTGVLRGGSTIVAGGMGYGAGGEHPMGAIGSAVAGNAANRGEQEVRQFMRTDPTLTIRPAYGCHIILEEELVLPGPYLGL